MFILAEMVLVPLTFGISALRQYNLEISLAITSLVTIYTIVATPYMHKKDNIRLLINRVLLTGIMGLLVYIKFGNAS